MTDKTKQLYYPNSNGNSLVGQSRGNQKLETVRLEYIRPESYCISLVYDITKKSEPSLTEIQNNILPEDKFTVIYTGNKTVVILDDDSTGIAKCSTEDEWDPEKGFQLASARAIIKYYEKKIKRLSLGNPKIEVLSKQEVDKRNCTPKGK